MSTEYRSRYGSSDRCRSTAAGSRGTAPRRRKKRRRRRLNYRPLILLLVLFCLIIYGFSSLVRFLDAPGITLSVADGTRTTVECGSEADLTPVTAMYTSRIFHRKGLDAQVVKEGDVDISRPGTYEITYTSSMKGRKSSVTCTYEVVDTQPPVITLVTGEDYYTRTGKEYVEEGFTAVDNCDGDLTEQVIREEADGKVTYTVSDSHGNTATAERTIHYKDKVVYLTFDDGPGPETQRLLDILAKYNAKATFFVTAQHEDYQDLIKKAYDAGHTIGVHTYKHDFSKVYSSVDSFFEDIGQMSDIIEQQTGEKPVLLRFPGGSGNSASRQYCSGIMTELVKEVENRGFVYVDWRITSGDADGDGKSASAIASNVIKGMQSYHPAIVLQHDTKKNSVTATEEILKWGTENGYSFLALSPTSNNYHGNTIRN